MKKVFISHSKKDIQFIDLILPLIEEMKSDVWFDIFDIDTGDSLISKIESGIDNAKLFVFILSENSLESSWVDYELNMATIKSLEDKNYRIAVLKIDSCETPLRFKPYLYKDISSELNNAKLYLKEIIQKSVPQRIRRNFINRTKEFDIIEEAIIDDNINIIFISGLFGIGKESLISESIKRYFYSGELLKIDLTRATKGSRLALEFCKITNTKIPNDNLTESECKSIISKSIEMIISQKQILFLNNAQNLIEDGEIDKHLFQILDKYKEIKISSMTPLFIASTKNIKFVPVIACITKFIQLKSIETRFINEIIKNNLPTILNDNYNLDNLNSISEYLHGYPFAAKLAAPLIANFGTEYLSQNIKHIIDLKIDIAESLLSTININDFDREIAGTISIINTPLSYNDIVAIFSDVNIAIINESFEKLILNNIFEIKENKIILHPITCDFFWKQIRNSLKFEENVKRVSNYALSKIDDSTLSDSEYIHWLIIAVKALYLSNKMDKAYELRNDLIGELKSVAIQFYQSQDYDKSLKYCNQYLEYKDNDFDILFHKARSLSRLGEWKKSIEILTSMVKDESISNFRKAKIYYAKGRTYIENKENCNKGYLDLALNEFLNAIRVEPKYTTPNYSIAEVYFRQNKFDSAKYEIEKLLSIEPLDAYALTLHSEILWKLDKKQDAIIEIDNALRLQPTNHNFLHKKAQFLLNSKNYQDASELLLKSLNQNPSYVDAKLSLASTYLNLDKRKEAKEILDELENDLKGYKRNILENIKANYELNYGNIDLAKKIINNCLEHNRDVSNISTLIKILEKERKEYEERMMVELAQENKKHIDILKDEIKSIEPNFIFDH